MATTGEQELQEQLKVIQEYDRQSAFKLGFFKAAHAAGLNDEEALETFVLAVTLKADRQKG